MHLGTWDGKPPAPGLNPKIPPSGVQACNIVQRAVRSCIPRMKAPQTDLSEVGLPRMGEIVNAVA